MDAAEFHAAVYHVVRQIPNARVTSYGHIAKLIGMPTYFRHVGQALKFLTPGSDVPWQRVISSSGSISLVGDAAIRQRQSLEAEGVVVTEANQVNLREYGWFPDPGAIDTGVENVQQQGGEEDHNEDED